MNKCQVCKQNEAIWAWQPFGPDDTPHSAFATLGSHYRGFPVIKVCDECRTSYGAYGAINFTYRGRPYHASVVDVAPDHMRYAYSPIPG